MPNQDFKLVQSIIFDLHEHVKGMEKLYYTGADFSFFDGTIVVRKNGTLDFFSYFNIFNLEKWERYTGIKSFFLRLNLTGGFRIRVFRHTGSRHSEIPWHDETVRADGWVTMPVLPSFQGGIYSLRIDALDDGVFRGGGWYKETLPEPGPYYRIALVICTYKREAYLLRNLRLLSRCLPAHWHVFVVDNGRTVTEELAGGFDERFHFFKNPNTGGTGGFTQGLIEVINHEHKWTHVLLMDDDVLIEPATLGRTDTLIRLLKPGYRKHFIGGAMLRLDRPFIQHESGAYWNGIRVKHLRHNYDLSQPCYILSNARTNNRKRQYAAWWYCVIPLTENTINDLPAPLFVNGDDIEYSIRRANGIILLSGIAVWHQPFHYKYNPVKQYYLTTRNGLIINARHGYSLLASLALVSARLLHQLSKRRWREARLVLRGLSDFLAGPGVLKVANTSELLSPTSIFTMSKVKLSPAHVCKLFFFLVWKYGSLRNAYGKMPLRDHEWCEINHGREKIAKFAPAIRELAKA